MKSSKPPVAWRRSSARCTPTAPTPLNPNPNPNPGFKHQGAADACSSGTHPGRVACRATRAAPWHSPAAGMPHQQRQQGLRGRDTICARSFAASSPDPQAQPGSASPPLDPSTAAAGRPGHVIGASFAAAAAHLQRLLLANIYSFKRQVLGPLQRLGLSALQQRMVLWGLQLTASLVSVVLYVWSTYSPAPPGSFRYGLDVALCAVFAVEFVFRVRAARSVSPLSLVDLLSFLPSLLEAAAVAASSTGLLEGVTAAAAAGKLGGIRLHLPDLKWLRILRSLRILRLFLLTGNLPVMKLSTSSLLSGAVNARLMQLVASVIALLFTSASLVHLAERMPWHDALYFVITSLTTVGYGDVVVKTMLGKMVVLTMISVGVVLIPVRTGQLWSQLVSQRVTVGRRIRARQPFVILSGRITDVRSFSDLYHEFSAQLKGQNQQGQLPADLHLVCLGSRPGNELLAFQELHDAQLTLVEGSVLRPGDLVRHRASAASALLVMANRFSPDVDTEDLDVLFRVWALKSFTKCVPLTVQVLRASSLAKVAPFLDPANDTIMSTQLTRHRLLALSCICPGASTLLCNLLQTAQISPDLQASATRGEGESAPQLAGRTWLAEYARGCGNELFVVTAGPGLDGAAWLDAVLTAYLELHVLLIGVNNLKARRDECTTRTGRLTHGATSLNPANHVIRQGEELLVIASSRQHADALRTIAGATPATSEMCVEVPWYQATLRWALDYSTSSDSSGDDPEPGPEQVNDARAAPGAVAVNIEKKAGRKRRGGGREAGGGGSGKGGGDAAGRLSVDEPGPGKVQRGADLNLRTHKLEGHVILSGSQDSFLDFASTLHAVWGRWRSTEPQWWPSSTSSWLDDEPEARKLPLVVLHPDLDPAILKQLMDLGPVHVVRGSPSNTSALTRASAKKARCLVYISSTQRPGTLPPVGEEQDYGTTSGAALRADAEALLTCYGVGEGEPAGLLVRHEGPGPGPGAAQLPAAPLQQTSAEGPGFGGPGYGFSEEAALGQQPGPGGALNTSSFEMDPFYIERGPPHTVCELAFTSSVRFLQPGLLLQGASTFNATACESLHGEPRNSWLRRLEAEAAAAAQGLVQYQTNVYYCAGRVVLPAHMDTFICQAFHKKRLLEDFMAELCRDDGRTGGSLLRQLPVPPQLGGRPYRELFQHLVDCHNVIPLGLLRPKAENAAWRLDYVSTNPAWEDIVDIGDRVFVLRPGDED